MDALPFYVIITPGSLKYLKFALWSLQQRSDMAVTLVANGLGAEENQALKQCADELAGQYIDLQSDHVLSHGLALNKLIAQHRSKWFCFCDSDIVSINATANDIPVQDNIKALSSCEAMFWGDDPVKGVLGRCNQWPDGSLNLSSFFCVYHTETTRQLMEKYHIGFENILAKQIPSTAIQHKLKQKGFNEANRKLDTGKALTIALDLEAQAYTHTDIPSLLHIGGLSSWILNGDKALVHAEYHLADGDLYQLAQAGSWLYNRKALTDSENQQFYLRRQQRLAAARYCFQLISHYVDQTPRPIHSLTDADFIQKIEHIVAALEQYHLSS